MVTDKAAIESAKARRHNGHPAIGHESNRRSVAVAANTPEPRMSIAILFVIGVLYNQINSWTVVIGLVRYSKTIPFF